MKAVSIFFGTHLDALGELDVGILIVVAALAG